MTKSPPLHVSIQSKIFELLDHEWQIGEPEYLFTLQQIMHLTRNLSGEHTYRKALKDLMAQGKILRKKDGSHGPYLWCSNCMRDRLVQDKQHKIKESRKWMQKHDLKILHEKVLNHLGGNGSLRRSRDFNLLEDHVQDFWVKILEHGFTTPPEDSLHLANWVKKLAFSNFRHWTQDLSLQISRGALSEEDRETFHGVMLNSHDYDDENGIEVRPKQGINLDARQSLQKLRQQFADIYKPGERYFRIYTQHKLGYSVAEIAVSENVSIHRVSKLLAHGNAVIKGTKLPKEPKVLPVVKTIGKTPESPPTKKRGCVHTIEDKLISFFSCHRRKRFTLKEIINLTEDLGSIPTYRKALKSLVSTGKIYRKKENPNNWGWGPDLKNQIINLLEQNGVTDHDLATKKHYKKLLDLVQQIF